MAQQQMIRLHFIAISAAARICSRVKPLPRRITSQGVVRRCSRNASLPLVLFAMNSRSKIEPGLRSSSASISFMMPRIAAMSPFSLTGNQRSLSGVPLLESIFAANFRGLRYSCGFGLTTSINPGSGIGLIATIFAPFFFARSRTVIIRG